MFSTIAGHWINYSPTDLGVKMEKIPGVWSREVLRGHFLEWLWEAFTPPHVGVTLGGLLHQLIVVFCSPTSIESIIYGKIFYTSWFTHVKFSHNYREVYMGRFYTTWRVATLLKPFHMNTEGAFPFISCRKYHVILLILTYFLWLS